MSRRSQADAPTAVPTNGGGLEGAQRTSRETALWVPSMRSPDDALNPAKPLADARSRDLSQNDGYMQGAVSIYRDSIVGSSYRLNSQPSWQVLKRFSPAFDETWSEEFQEAVEEQFNLAAESADCWFDASRRLTFTGLIRLSVAQFVLAGEPLGVVEWLRDSSRPFNTAVQMISPDRLSNPRDEADTPRLRRGVVRDSNGRHLGYHIRKAHPGDATAFTDIYEWEYVPARKPWGRKIVLHITENMLPDQTRGVAEMVAGLKHMRMTKTIDEMMLQNAVVSAMYAAAIESELPNELVGAMMGGAGDPSNAYNGFIQAHLAGLAAYLSQANNIAIDGVKIPHLYPGTKLNIKSAGTPGIVGTDFEASLLRKIAATLNLSYEEFANDWSKTNYSSGRASVAKSQRAMQSRKKFVADRMADDIFALWLEEALAARMLPLPRSVAREVFYLPMAKDAFCQASWIGAGRGQIDELKETQAALLRINGGLSTYEDEIAQLGGDWRRRFRQRAREERMKTDLSLTFSAGAERPGQQDAGNTLREKSEDE